MDLVKQLRENPFALAPMAGITDHSFRTFMKKRGASVVVTELVSATGIEYKSQRTLDLMSFDEVQRPIGIQLFGEEPEVLARAAQVAQEMGADFVDLNFGCPVPKVVKKGAGSAMLRDLPQLTAVLRATKTAIQIPLTIKIRTGWDQNSRNASEVCHIAYNEGVTWVAIHGRTRAQGYSGDADWNFIADVKAKSKIPILGNGDINSAHTAVRRLKESGVDGVLIGRGALKNPYIFLESMNLWKALKNRDSAVRDYSLDQIGSCGQQSHRLPPVTRHYVEIFEDLKSCFMERCDDRIVQIQLKKFAGWFSAGYPESSAFRKNVFQIQSTDELVHIAKEYFAKVDSAVQEDTSNEPFLMGGHG
ncbi:MAG: tRNA dihydrouridine synthase DusB [Pseudobdellovibrionaceae bacterium]